MSASPEQIEAAAQAIRRVVMTNRNIRMRPWESIQEVLRMRYREEAAAALEAAAQVGGFTND